MLYISQLTVFWQSEKSLSCKLDFEPEFFIHYKNQYLHRVWKIHLLALAQASHEKKGQAQLTSVADLKPKPTSIDGSADSPSKHPISNSYTSSGTAALQHSCNQALISHLWCHIVICLTSILMLCSFWWNSLWLNILDIIQPVSLAVYSYS